MVGHVADGMINKEIAEKAGISAVNASRDLALLESLGWVRKSDAGRWFLTMKPLALLKTYEMAHNDMIARAEETRGNIAAAAVRHGR